MGWRWLWIGVIVLGILPGCQSMHTTKMPITYNPSPQQVSLLKPSLPEHRSNSLSSLPWETEKRIGIALGNELDLYRAITAFKRALILLPDEETYLERRQEILYNILLAYYLGEKYLDAAKTFNMTALSQATPDFFAYQDLAVILYDSYLRLQDHQDTATYVLNALSKVNEEKANDLILYRSILDKDWEAISAAADATPTRHYFQTIRTNYAKECKSVDTAYILSALLPGSGYWYVGQKKSAITSLLLNTLFIIGTFELFDHGLIAPGIITAGFELGWYVGGIYGAGMAAKEYNEQLYDKYSYKMLQQERLFPFLMLQYGF